ncbi:MAG: GNAT family N-acetyltransferase [Lachnospiraceae bacterium]|nr:GNAT family N-acetyltransferase [Lachnospiraceae bacterium]
MKKLTESDRRDLLEYLLFEPEINAFFIGVIENHSLECDEVTVYVEDSNGDGTWDVVLLRYCENYIIYGNKENFDLISVVNFLQRERILDSVNGKASIIRKIAPYFPQMQMEEKSVLRLDKNSEAPPENNKTKVRVLTPDDARKITNLYAQNENYRAQDLQSREKATAEHRANLAGGGIAVGLIYNHKLVSVAEIIADNDMIGLIVGVATHPKYYGRGFATQTIAALCAEAFRRGKKYVCVLHDESDNISILKHVGFQEKSHYSLLHKQYA